MTADIYGRRAGEALRRSRLIAQLEQEGLALGFKFVAAGPLVRSSYKAGEFFVQRWVEEERKVAVS